MSDITFSDISQWQPTIDAPAYLAGGHTVLIARAFSRDPYGPDAEMPERRDYLRQFNFDAIGYYQRPHAERDPAQQARDFINTIGPLRDNEFPVLDLEDGSGNQTGRADAWLRVVDDWCGFKATLYSGAYFMRDNLGGTGRWGNRPLWIATYTGNGQPNPSEEPAGCDWWQFSCTHHFPGLPGEVDANVYHDTPQAFLKLVRPGAAPAATAGDPAGGGPVVLNHDGRLEVFAGNVTHRWQTKPGQAFNDDWATLGHPAQGVLMLSCVLNHDGRVEAFVVTPANEILHRWQAVKGGGWNEKGWESLGRPGDRANDDTAISAILNHDGRVEVFAYVADEVFHRWQEKPGQAFVNAWVSLGVAA